MCVGVCLIDVQANAGFVAGKRHFGQGAQQRFADAATALLWGNGNGVQIPFVREGFGVGKEALRRVKAVLLQDGGEGGIDLRFVFRRVAEGSADDAAVEDFYDAARVAVAVVRVGDGAGEQGACGFQAVAGEEGQFHRLQHG